MGELNSFCLKSESPNPKNQLCNILNLLIPWITPATFFKSLNLKDHPCHIFYLLILRIILPHLFLLIPRIILPHLFLLIPRTILPHLFLLIARIILPHLFLLIPKIILPHFLNDTIIVQIKFCFIHKLYKCNVIIFMSHRCMICYCKIYNYKFTKVM